jgi:pimeloyl-ACP methyl ester carboxylesterase
MDVKEVFMKKSTKCFLFLTAAATTGIYAYNKFVAYSATKNNHLSVKGGYFYNWKQGKVFYSKQGEGSPVLLIHDVHPSSSGYEWNRIVKRLEKKHTVYTLDLIGCGRSDKPPITYTNYLYVQLITAFIKDVIQETPDVIASNLSASFIIMANNLDKTLFNKIILINPISVRKLKVVPDDVSRFKQLLMNLPILGTFLYNVTMNPIHIDREFRNRYYAKSKSITSQTEDVYYESAHLKNNRGKYLYSSLLGNFVNINISNALKKIDKPVYLIGSRGIKNNIYILEEYRRLNSQFEIYMTSNSNLYPQLESPENIATLIKLILK